MKNNKLKKMVSFLLTGSLSVMNIPFLSSAAEGNISTDTDYDETYPEPIILNIEQSDDANGDSSLTYLDENGMEILFDLIPENNSVRQSQLPAKYDLRELDQLPAVRSQYDTSTCWAHSAMAAAESNLIKQGLADTSIDLSETHLVWFGNCAASSDPGDPLYNEGYSYGIEGYTDHGGNFRIAVATLARGSGIEYEKNLPAIVQKANIDESNRYVSHGYIQNSDIIDKDDMTNIKSRVMSSGALMMSYYDDETSYYDISHHSYYAPVANNTNHAVNIVGWDDNFSRYNFGDNVPEGDGAWICRNSWGTHFGENGYFYLSYYDKTIDGITSIEIGESGKYDNIYQYDGMVKSSMGYTSGGVAAGNIFTSSENETLTAAGFYTNAASIPYNISVYTDVTGKSPVNGTLVSSQDGYAEFAGYHTIDLEKNVPLKAGQNFSVVVTLKAEGAYFSMDNCGDDLNCTYFTYYDLSRNKASSSWTDSAVKYNQNTCIKALTTQGIPIDNNNFPDGSFRDYISMNIDADGNGILSPQEIDSTNSIDVDARGIADLRGIERFTSLTDLSCGHNSLISLDVSKNTQLKNLDCEGNIRNLGEPSCGAWVTLGININKVIKLEGAVKFDDFLIPEADTITYTYDCGNDFSAEFTILSTTSHSYADTAPYDDNSHANTCLVCGRSEFAPHDYGDWADNGNDTLFRVCSQCGFKHISPVDEHHFGSWTSDDSRTHSKTCSDCGTVITADHNMDTWVSVDDENCRQVCSDCQYEITEKHDFSVYQKIDDETHAISCLNCGETKIIPHNFGDYTDNGSAHQLTCNDCGEIIISMHDFGDWSNYDEEQDSRTCDDCGRTEFTSHNYSQLSPDDYDTHSFTCEYCGDVITEEHIYDIFTDNGNGTHKVICSICGYTQDNSHTYSDLADNGSGVHCQECIYCYSVNSGLHDFNAWQTTSEGVHSRTCKDCGYTVVSDHNYEQWTADKNGHSHICTDCGNVESFDHSFGNWTNDTNSKHIHTCDDCGYAVVSDHNYGQWTSDKNEHSHICEDCGNVESSDHAFGDWNVNINATQTRSCTVCGYSETETLDIIRGDINGDNIIDAFDIVLIRRALIFGIEKAQELSADFNNDGTFSIADLVALQRYILRRN